jgi:hypothetical protein
MRLITGGKPRPNAPALFLALNALLCAAHAPEEISRLNCAKKIR